MDKLYKLIARPILRDPYLIAAWPGIANVAILTAEYLMNHLPFKELAVIKDSYFFDPIGVSIKNGFVEEPKFPESRFYYYKNDSSQKDIILFMGEDQPKSKGYEMAHIITDIAQRFGVNRIYTCAAALTHIHHTEASRVWSAYTDRSTADELAGRADLHNGGNFQISGLNGILLGVAKERAVSAACLLGEVPSYAAKMDNPQASLAILKILSELVGVKINTKKMEKDVQTAKEKIKQVTDEAMGDYIDFFTEPIWENEEYDEDEGSEENNER
jgi:proteasome assembly chaperone (PAC2) family protein